jgi:predicted HicB family RNase H-like nuclease
MRERLHKVVITFRIDPELKEIAKKVAWASRQTLSKYVEELIRVDLWRKHMLG